MKLLWLLMKWTVKSIAKAFTLKLSWTSQLPIALGKSFINREPFHLFSLPTPLHPKAGLQMKCLIYLSVVLLQSSWFAEKKRIYQPRPFFVSPPTLLLSDNQGNYFRPAFYSEEWGTSHAIFLPSTALTFKLLYANAHMLTFIVEGSSGGFWHLMAFMSIYSVRLLRSCGELCNSFHPSSFFRRSPSPQPVVLWFSSSSHSQILFI